MGLMSLIKNYVKGKKMKGPRVEPCPRCQKYPILLISFSTNIGKEWQCKCLNCGEVLQAMDSLQKAIILWNNRAKTYQSLLRMLSQEKV